MAAVSELISHGATFPIEYVVSVVALSALALAAFAIYAVHSIARRKD